LQQPLSVNIYDNPNIKKLDINLNYTTENFKSTLHIIQDYVNSINDGQIDNSRLYQGLHNYYNQAMTGNKHE